MDNLKGAAIMVFAMLGFAIEDAFIKLLAGVLPVGQVIASLGAGGALVFAVLVKAQGLPLFPRAILARPVLLRNLGEVIGTLGFVTAIALIPLSTASAIVQAIPLFVTLGAALFLGEPVGWRRWSAILVGFAGVLLIIRPGMAGFDWQSLFALQAVFGLAIRDLATRRVAVATSSIQLSFLAFFMLIPTGGMLLWLWGDPPLVPTGTQWAFLAGAIGFAAISYNAIVVAMRIGEISFVTPFRYSRMIFALVIGVVVFAERPDALTLIGAGIIIASGLYTLWRERCVRTVSANPLLPTDLAR